MQVRLDPILKAKVAAQVAAILPEVIAFRRQRHRHPELSWQEHDTAAAVATALRKLPGIEVKQGVGRLGVVGLIEGGRRGPTVALRSDMDALPIQEASGVEHSSERPGSMHACGHDGHMANLLGAAMVLANMREHLHGQVKLIFQPAEEGGFGAKIMCEDGVLDQPKVDVIFGLHGWPELEAGKIYVKTGPMLAATTVLDIVISGTGCHAAMPHLGTDQILVAARIIEALQAVSSRMMAPTEPIALSITQVHGGTADNVLPQQVRLRGTLRTMSAAIEARCLERIRTISHNIATAHGARVQVESHSGYPPTVNHPGPTDYIEAIARELIGDGVERLPHPTMGGEDFAFYLQRVPGSFVFLGLGDGRSQGYPSLHDPAFDFNDRSLPIGIQLFVHAALQYAASTGR